MNGAQALVKCLEAEKVKYVFGYSGVAICPFYDAVYHSNLKTVLIRTEQSAAHAASGMARLTGKAAVCAVTSGPGATNLITGIATAFADSIPMICITGQVNSELIGSDVFQEADITGAVESFVKYSYLVKDPDDVPRIVKEAFHIANSGRPGPVLIDFPSDVQNAELKKAFDYPAEVKLRTYKPTIKGNALQIKKVIRELEKARKPLICAGGGVHLCNAVPELMEFVEEYKVPVISTMMGIGVLPTEHPLYFGMVGNNGSPAANRAMREADMIIMLGARVADRAVNQPEVLTENTVLVHIDVDPAEIGKNAGATIPIVGDAKHILKDMNEYEVDTDTDEWIKELEGYRRDLKVIRPEHPGFVDPALFVRKLSEKLEDTAVYVADVGQNQIWSCRNHIVRKGRFLTSGGMGTMGYSIPAAMGAKLAAPDRQVVAVCGDGSFQMSMMELATIQQNNVDVKIIVMRNNYLGMVRQYEHFSLKDRYMMVDIGALPKLDDIASAYGMGYVLIKDMTDVSKKIDQVLKSKGACICECLVDPMDLV